MASITIMAGHKNLIFAALLAEHVGAEFREEGSWITVEKAERLDIPRYIFDDAFDPNGVKAQRGDSQLARAWRSLILNKRGHLKSFGDDEIVIVDSPEDERPQYLLRFNSTEEKAEAEEWAERAGFATLREYIVWAICSANEFWADKAMEKEANDGTS